MSEPPASSIRSVLHTTDFSPDSIIAFEHALCIALAARANFDILHVGANEASGAEWSRFPEVRETLERWGLLAQGTTAAAVGNELGINVSKRALPSGDVVTAVSEFIFDAPPDLVVLATEGREGLPLWIRSSVAERLSRAAMKEGAQVEQPVSTLFVPRGADGFILRKAGQVAIRNVLIPLAPDPDPEIAVEAAASLLKSLGAEDARIFAVHIGPMENIPKVRAPVRLSGGFDVFARLGAPDEEIPALQAELEADLIVMATKGHQGFLDALRGSTTERVVRHASCPVLAVSAFTSDST